MTYVHEYRHSSMLPEEITGVAHANGISTRVGPDESWETADFPIGTEKTVGDYEDFLYSHHRSTLLRQWSEINHTHERFGCPLDPAEDNSWAPCVIHGMHKGDRELTREQFLGSFAEPREV